MSFAGRRRGNKVKKGVQFTIMVVGQFFVCTQFGVPQSFRFSKTSGASGTGRTTFVNTLCEAEVLPHKTCDDPANAHIEEGIKIKPVTVGLSHLLFSCASLSCLNTCS